MAAHEAWQLRGEAAELYERHLVPAITAIWAEDLVARAALVEDRDASAREALADAIAADIQAALGSAGEEVISPARSLVLTARR